MEHLYADRTPDTPDVARPDPVAELLARATRHETGFAGADGAGRLVWHAWGEGPPVVLLHGGVGSWRHWVRNIAPLARTRRVVAVDLPGLGESDRPAPPYRPEASAAIVAAGLRELLPAGTRCDLVGFSFGSLAAGHVAAAAPELIRSLTLVGAGGLGTGRAPIVLVPVRSLTGAEREAAHRTNLARLMIADPARIDPLALAVQDWNSRRARVNSVGFATSTTLLDALGRVQAPIAALWGERDQVAVGTLEARIAAIRAMRPEAKVTLIPAAGHWVSFEAAPAFNAALATLLPA